MVVAARADDNPRIITFDVPGAGTMSSVFPGCQNFYKTLCNGTTPMANNNAGEIVGQYITNEGVYYGFLRSPEGKVTTLSEPNADTTPGHFNGTYPISLNSRGAVTGSYQMADGLLHGFIREPDGSYIEVDDPAAGTAAGQGGTWSFNINDRGEVAGFYYDSSNVLHGFIRSPQGEFTTVDGPNADNGAFSGTMIALEQGLNARGSVAGSYTVSNVQFGLVTYGFVREANGKFITIDPVPSSPGVIVTGINSAGAVTGNFVPLTSALTGSLPLTSGFLQRPDGQITIFNVPGPAGAAGTSPSTLNSRNEVTGFSVDASFQFHGFIRSAKGDIKTFDAPQRGTGFLQGTGPVTNNDSGQVIGWVLDSNNVAHGFIRDGSPAP